MSVVDADPDRAVVAPATAVSRRRRDEVIPRIDSMPALRVLILSRHPDQQGGVVNYLRLLVQRLDARITPEIFLTGRRPGESGILRTAGRLCADFLRFAWTVGRRRYDVVHLNPTLDVASTLRDAGFLLILKLMRFRRTVVFFRGWEIPWERRIARNRIYRWLFRWLFGTPGQILVLSRRFETALRQLGCDARIDVVTTMFDGRPLKQALDENPRNSGARSVLYLSRFVREKGVYELVEAFAEISGRYPDAVLTMAGDGPEADGLKDAVRRLGVEGRVRFPGYLRGLEKARAFVEARAFVLATTYPEGMPNALLEALAAGNVVITTRVAGIPDVVDDPDNGVLLKDVTTESIRTALERILGDDEYCRTVRARNMAKAWSRFEADLVTRRIEDVYMRLAAGTRQREPAASDPMTDSNRMVSTMDEAAIRTFWNANPCGEHQVGPVDADYDDFFRRYDAFRYATQGHILRRLDAIDWRGKRVLEIGLGQGADSEQLIRRGAMWSGLDLTEESIDRVRTRLALRNLPFDELKCGSVLCMPFESHSFDIVYSHGVLHHVPDIDTAQREIARVLKPGGDLVMMVYAKASLNYVLSISLLRRIGLLALFLSGAEWNGIYGEHLRNARRMGILRYLRMSSFIHRNTDGPLNPYSRVYTLRDVRTSFRSFRVTRCHKEFMHAPPLPVSRLLGHSLMGWHLWVQLSAVPDSDPSEDAAAKH